jgi:hypothetical protein
MKYNVLDKYENFLLHKSKLAAASRFFLAWFCPSVLKLEAISSAKLSADFCTNTWQYIPKEKAIQEMVILHWCPSTYSYSVNVIHCVRPGKALRYFIGTVYLFLI